MPMPLELKYIPFMRDELTGKNSIREPKAYLGKRNKKPGYFFCHFLINLLNLLDNFKLYVLIIDH
jgi:hypothetical protein